MRHIVTSESGKPGMTLDQLQAALDQARRSGATGGEVVRARLYGRDGGLRSITVELDETLAELSPPEATGRPNRRKRAQGGTPAAQSGPPAEPAPDR